MQLKTIFQTIGTLLSLVLAFITLKVTNNLLDIDVLNLVDISSKYGEFLLTILTVVIMIVTGFSYYKSKDEHEGINRVLYFLLAIAHIILAPIAFIVGVMKITFGEYWLAALIGILILIYFGSQKRESED